MSVPPITNDQLALARSKLWTPDLDRLLRRWKDQIGKRQAGHSRQARKYSRRHYILGVPVTLLVAVSATGTLSTFRQCNDCEELDSARCQIDQWIRFAMGVLGVISGALLTLMTFINYQEFAEQHKGAASDFENLHRVIETLLQVPGSVRGDPVSTLHSIRDQYTSLVRSSPQLPKGYAVDLLYRFNGSSPTKGLPKPPEPSQITLNETKNGTNPLRKLLDDETSKTKAKIKKVTGVESQSEDEEVSIGFDLDCAQATSESAIKAALLAVEREGQVQQSLSKALEFELQRLNTHIEPEDTPLEDPPLEDSSDGDSEGTETDGDKSHMSNGETSS